MPTNSEEENDLYEANQGNIKLTMNLTNFTV